ncbi:hypothetical protein, partial [Streptomyces sp. SID8499]|uniref:hypothetical protein n=1 Tax=Streptomyces sp. SID8499 TaxID=2706106 RepID=UPI00194480D9
RAGSGGCGRGRRAGSGRDDMHTAHVAACARAHPAARRPHREPLARALRGLKGRVAAKAGALVAGEPYAWCSASTPC